MSRFRTHLMALLGGAMLLALPVSGALGHASSGDFGGGAKNHGQAVSAFVHSLVFGDEDAAEEEPADEGDADADTDADAEDTDTEDTDTDDETVDEDADSEEGEQGSHGACVSEVARSDQVGGENENHGGAVSLAARETCWEDPVEELTDGDTTEGEPTDESAVDADGSDAGPGKSKAAHDRGQKGMHGHGGHHGASARWGDRG
jgi:hypothetical protein